MHSTTMRSTRGSIALGTLPGANCSHVMVPRSRAPCSGLKPSTIAHICLHTVHSKAGTFFNLPCLMLTFLAEKCLTCAPHLGAQVATKEDVLQQIHEPTRRVSLYTDSESDSSDETREGDDSSCNTAEDITRNLGFSNGEDLTTGGASGHGGGGREREYLAVLKPTEAVVIKTVKTISSCLRYNTYCRGFHLKVHARMFSWLTLRFNVYCGVFYSCLRTAPPGSSVFLGLS